MILNSVEKKSQSTMLTSSVDTGSLAHENIEMQMYDSDLFKNAKGALEMSGGVRQAFDIFPAGCAFKIVLDNRIPCLLKLTDSGVVLEPESGQSADFELVLFSESIRRLKSLEFSDFFSIAKEISAQVLLGHIRFKLLISPIDLYKKGYAGMISKLGPEFQKVLTQIAFGALGQVSTAADKFKSLFRR